MNYEQRLKSAKGRIRRLANGDFLLSLISHLEVLGLSAGRVAKYANHVCVLMRKHPFDPKRS